MSATTHAIPLRNKIILSPILLITWPYCLQDKNQLYLICSERNQKYPPKPQPSGFQWYDFIRGDICEIDILDPANLINQTCCSFCGASQMHFFFRYLG